MSCNIFHLIFFQELDRVDGTMRLVLQDTFNIRDKAHLKEKLVPHPQAPPLLPTTSWPLHQLLGNRRV